jgi:O-antigen ligase
MISRITRSKVIAHGTIPVLFVLTLPYQGAALNLHWLSLSGVLLFAWLIRLFAKSGLASGNLTAAWPTWAAILYLLWLMIAPFLSAYPYAASASAATLVALPLVYLGWLIQSRQRDGLSWERTWYSLLACATALAAWGLTDAYYRHERAHGPFIDPSAYAALINLFLVPCIHRYLGAPGSGRALGNSHWILGAIALLSLAQFASLSRGALLAFASVLPFLFWFDRKRPAFRIRLSVLLAILAVAYAIIKFAPIEQRQGLETLLTDPGQYVERDSSIQERLLLLKSTWRMIGDSNPWIGDGLGTFKLLYPAYRDENEPSAGNFAHNDYLQSLLEGGLVQLCFFLLTTILAPILLLRRISLIDSGGRDLSEGDVGRGLLLGILCISAHAFVNFIHYVYPIAFLTGLYLARSWESAGSPGVVRLTERLAKLVRPHFLKGALIIPLVITAAVLAMDGISFKLFSTDPPALEQLPPEYRFPVLNLALTVRPGNPIPRVMLIRQLLQTAQTNSRTDAADSRRIQTQALEQAQREIQLLAASSPGLPAAHFFRGQHRMIRNAPGDLEAARIDLERAVRMVPQATGMRLALVNLYGALGLTEEAYQTVVEAKKWVRLEVDLRSLAEFSRTAVAIAKKKRDSDEAAYWTWLYERLTIMGYALS